MVFKCYGKTMLKKRFSSYGGAIKECYAIFDQT